MSNNVRIQISAVKDGNYTVITTSTRKCDNYEPGPCARTMFPFYSNCTNCDNWCKDECPAPGILNTRVIPHKSYHTCDEAWYS